MGGEILNRYIANTTMGARLFAYQFVVNLIGGVFGILLRLDLILVLLVFSGEFS